MYAMLFALLVQQSAPPPPSPAFAFVAEYDRMSATALWPGYSPKAVPLMVYDGTATYLFRHPNPPMEFTEAPGQKSVRFFDGQHPDIRANSSVLLNGVAVATVLLDDSKPVKEEAAIGIHEAFHVFQRERHADWGANEAELFTYPVGDSANLTLRFVETRAVVRALEAKGLDETACWARAALRIRDERFKAIAPAAAAYERGTEMLEGLAFYVQGLAEGTTLVVPPEDYPSEEVRRRAYTIGHAFALLLDRIDPDWRIKIEAGGFRGQSLDQILAGALGPAADPVCELGKDEIDSATARAQAEAGRVAGERGKLRSEFLSREGWRVVVIDESDEPLWPNGFDPMNVTAVTVSEVLHRRWVKLGNEAGFVEVLNRPALSTAAGDHPLMEGVRKVEITGIANEPTTGDKEGTVLVSAEGVRIEFKRAAVTKHFQTLTVVLKKAAEGDDERTP